MSPIGTREVAGARRMRYGLLAALAVVVVVLVAALVGLRSPATTKRSSDGPRVSFTQATGGELRLEAITFANASRGEGLVLRQGTTYCTAEVGPTGDGGARFGPLVPVTSWKCADGAPASSLAFDGRGDGFLFGPRLFVTHDDGRTWAAVPGARDVLDVVPVGSSVWMVEAYCASSSSLRCPLRLMVSSDGGRAWSSLGTAPSVSGNLLSGQGANGQTWLDRVSRSVAYLVGSPRIPVASSNGHLDPVPLWYTANAGRSWVARSIPCGPGALSVELTVAPGGELFAGCASQPGAGSQAKEILASSDGGLHWDMVSGCDPFATGPQPCEGQDALVTGYLSGLAAMSSKTLLLVEGRGPLLESSDGGAHWSAPVPYNGGGGMSEAVVLDPMDAIVLGLNGETQAPMLWRTSDGGARWVGIIPQLG
jgi:photosystem II stability/assembly factor-like uncharacterized protein